uniref:Protocadherin-15 n=2 Tax=Cacopsylla melanoneura TaxID=428564 RepID=A0A8D8MA25_9HEMI
MNLYFRFSVFILLKSLVLQVTNAAKQGLCEVETGQSNIILDIQESRGSELGQETTPAELPIFGDPDTDIVLDLIFPKGNPVYFALDGKKLRLLAPLDRDADNKSHLVFQLTCTVKVSNRKRTIPVIVRVSDVNDNAPRFLNTPYETTVSELTPVGTTIFNNLKAVDADAGANGLVEYHIVPSEDKNIGTADGTGKDRVTVVDGYSYFSINLPHQGQVTVNRSLDFEKTQRYLVTIVASDRARNQAERLSSTTTLTVNIKDEDDQDPSFVYQGCALQDSACINPEYHATVSSGVLSGVLTLSPEKIQAIDMDSIQSPIMYSFLSGTPSTFRDYFSINPQTGVVRQTHPVEYSSAMKKFEIVVKAEEISESHRFTTARLFIEVKPVDANPPQIILNAGEGFVDENSPVGTKVTDTQGNRLRLLVNDADLGPDDPKPAYMFELTTNFFDIDAEGYLVVSKENLDRDPPNPGKFRFQVIAREKQGTAASAPVTLTVHLNDINDNAPRLPMIPPIQIQAGDARRQIVKIEATDNDLGVNAEITYSIYHVSNTGLAKFRIEPKSGIIETTGKLIAGEQYSITVQATDTGGKSSQTIVEVSVIPGPNTRSPVFQQNVYDVNVSEGASINSTVTTIVAVDPENDPVSYSIISGNDLRQFSIGDKSGVISVIRKLDREDLTRYQLLITAEDEGGLSSTATVNVRVTDINDKNPEFQGLPYEFSVAEAQDGAAVGRVYATDADEGQNAVVYYSLPEDIPFVVDANTGDIRTNKALDYEKQQEYRFVVTAKDGASDPRIATATVTVKVTDVQDEVPVFHLTNYEARVPENVADYKVAQVKAEDPDSVKVITYTIRQGPIELFAIDPQTGVIKTIRGLDYEKENQHTLLIGTVENQSNEPGATTRVIVQVEDRNDNAPVFITMPRPLTLDDDTPLGNKITSLIATDADGTSPGNKVRYELVGKGKSLRYFQIDPDMGTLTLRDDLRKEEDNEYQVDVKAYDLGEPQLSSVMSLPIFVRHVATVPPDVGLAFADDSYTIQIGENAAANTLVKTLNVINNRVHSQVVPLRCSLSSDTYGDLFSVNVTADRNCEVRLTRAELDYETAPEYNLTVRLDTLTGLVNPSRSLAHIKIQVVDLNDNAPVFEYPENTRKFNKQVFYGAMARDKHELGVTLMQVKATDKDSGKYGLIEYRLLDNNSDTVSYFNLDPSTGILKNVKVLSELTAGQLPLRLTVEARDNPTGTEEESNVVTTTAIINLVEDKHRIILYIADARADRVKSGETDILSVLEGVSGLVVGVEKIAAHQSSGVAGGNNGSLATDASATDLWFYAIDPVSDRILDRNTSRVARSFLEPVIISNITHDISASLHATVTDIHPPPLLIQPVVTKKAIVAVKWEVFPYAMIAIAALVLVLGIAGVVYICISWSRYKAYKDRMNRMYMMPRSYDNVFQEPNLKEYETQVLQMSVPIDGEEDYTDLHVDFSRRNHAFSMENVSYISKQQNGTPSPVSSDAATTARASSVLGSHTMSRRPPSNVNMYNNSIPSHATLPRVPLYNNQVRNGNLSHTNENVTFKEKKDFNNHQLAYNYLLDRSPIETTTEL